MTIIHVEGVSKLLRHTVKSSRIVDDEFKSTIYEMATQAVKLEDAFVDDIQTLNRLKD